MNAETEAVPFPYTEHEGDPLWPVVDKALGDLVENSDLEEQTPRRYIVGYLIQSIRAVLPADAAKESD